MQEGVVFKHLARAIVDEQTRQQKPLDISLVDNQGLLVASPAQERLLQPMLDELPGLAEALAGRAMTRVAPGPQHQDWLFSAVPVPASGWAVVVQRPSADALATVTTFTTWLLVMAGLFALGGLLYTGGVVFYVWERIRFSHAVWHLFVLGGSLAHFFAILWYALPVAPR